MCVLWRPMSPKKPWTVIVSEDVAAHNESIEDAACYAPRGDFLIGLAQEALSFTRRRKLEKEIALIKSALNGHDDKPPTRRAEQLTTRLDELNDGLNSNP